MSNDRTGNRLLYAILLGIVVGIVLGGFLPATGRALYFLGEIFIKALLVLVVPLIVTSMVVGISRLGDIRKLGSIGGWTIIYYMMTTALSVIVGILLVNVIQPGRADTQEERVALRGGVLLVDMAYQIQDDTLILDNQGALKSFDERYMVILLDQDGVRGVISEGKTEGIDALRVEDWCDAQGHIIRPASEGKGLQIDLAVASRIRGKERSIVEVLKEVIVGLVPGNLFSAMAHNDVLPLIVFSLIFGAVLTTIGEKGRPVILLFEGLNEAIMRIVHLLMYVAPVGIGALLAGRLGNAGGFIGFWPELLRLGKYALTVVLGLSIHALIVLPLILLVFGRKHVVRYAANVATALTTAFSTASSAATLPLTMQCVTEKNTISKRTASFVLPLGATINMDGTALYEAVAAIFIAQIYGVSLGPIQMVIIFLTATLAAIGAAGIPEAGLVTMVIVLQAVHLPIEGITLILVIDWFLDRCRTTVNVWGDAVGAAVVERFQQNGRAFT